MGWRHFLQRKRKKKKKEASEDLEFLATICGVWLLGRLQDVIWKETVQNWSVCLSEFIQCDQVTSLNKHVQMMLFLSVEIRVVKSLA